MKQAVKAQCAAIYRETEASQIAESAIVLPIVLLLIFGILSTARAYNIYTTVTFAAQEGARVAVQETCATCGNTASVASDVANRVTQVLQASKIDPGQIQTYAGTSTPPSCTGGGGAASTTSGNITLYTNAEVNSTAARRRRRGGGGGTTVTGPTACGSVVTFQYPFQFTLPFTSLNQQVVTLTASAQLAGEN